MWIRGSELEYSIDNDVRIEGVPKNAYEFDLLEPSKYWSPIPNVVFLNGEVVNGAVANDSLLQTLNVDIPVTI